MGMKSAVPNFWDWDWEWKTRYPSFGIGNEKQCSQPNLGNNWLKSIGKKLGTVIPAYACTKLPETVRLVFSMELLAISIMSEVGSEH